MNTYVSLLLVMTKETFLDGFTDISLISHEPVVYHPSIFTDGSAATFDFIDFNKNGGRKSKSVVIK